MPKKLYLSALGAAVLIMVAGSEPARATVFFKANDEPIIVNQIKLNEPLDSAPSAVYTLSGPSSTITFPSWIYSPIGSSPVTVYSSVVTATSKYESETATIINAPTSVPSACSNGSCYISAPPAPNPQPAETVSIPASAALPLPTSQETRIEAIKPNLLPTLAVPAALVSEPNAAEQAETARWFEDKQPIESQVIKKPIVTKKVVKKKTVKLKKQSAVIIKKKSVSTR